MIDEVHSTSPPRGRRRVTRPRGCASLAACTTDGTDPEGPDGPAVEPSLVFAGPNGEVPGLLDELQLTDDEIAEIQAGEYTAAFVWHGSGDFVSAVERGARAEFEELGIEVVATTEAAFDPAAQANNVQSVMALDPDIVVAIAADPTSAAASSSRSWMPEPSSIIMTKHLRRPATRPATSSSAS